MSQNANYFELENKDLTITYAEEGVAGGPTFTYQQGKISISTQKIYTENTGIGKIVTIDIEEVPDNYTKHLSIFLPVVTLDDTLETDCATSAIFSTEYTTLAGPDPIPGQQTVYDALNLPGKAKFVVAKK